VVQLPTNTEYTHTVQEAIKYNFEGRTNQANRELRELLREGQRALFIGAPILAFSLIVSQAISNAAGTAAFSRVVSESLLIFGWVANWRALEIFLYGWWPIAHRRRLYRRLSSAYVKVLSI